jgi:hypothetical protein
MTQSQSIIELKQKVLSALQISSESFYHGFEITKGDPAQIDEGTYKKLQSNATMCQHLFDTVKFFSESYNDGSVDDNFAFDLISQLVTIETQSRNNSTAVECLCIFLNAIFPKIASNWDGETKKKLINIIKEMQELIVSTDDHSARVKEMTTELLISMKLRFHSDVQIKEEKPRDHLFTIDDLRKLSANFLRSSFMKQ